MRGRLVYNPFGIIFLILMVILLGIIVSLLFLGLLSTAFTRVGFSWSDALLILLACLIGSSINIPFMTLQSSTPMIKDTYVRGFGVTYRIPVAKTVRNDVTVAVNLGGAIIPVIVCIYLLSQFEFALPYAIGGTFIVAAITHMVARPIEGLGIATPALIPPLTAALGSIVLVALFNGPHESLFVTAYTSGVLGTLIGADLLNLDKVKDLGAPIVSIGGAGTFDGVFLSGIIAVLIV
jgi:uncharacterized membrane protein